MVNLEEKSNIGQKTDLKTGVSILSDKDTIKWANRIIEFYEHFEDITDYFVERKLEKIKEVNNTFFGFGQCDELFNDHTLNPKDMNFELIECDTKEKELLWNDLTQITATFPIEVVPARNLKILVKETNTQKIIGMVRLSSPILQIKRRNAIFGSPLDPKYVNPNVVNGSVIVPAQPFGYNALGGKLMTLICCSNEVKSMWKKNFDIDITLFETTSLYGNIKGTSQYDGLKPFLKYGGDTETNFLPHPTRAIFSELRNDMRKSKKGKDLIDGLNSGINGKIWIYLLRHMKKRLRLIDEELSIEYEKSLEHIQSIATNKRYYYCDYGIENLSGVILENAKPQYKNGMSKDKFDLDNIINWWKNKAQKRYDKVQLRTELEYWDEDKLRNKSIDIIR